MYYIYICVYVGTYHCIYMNQSMREYMDADAHMLHVNTYLEPKQVHDEAFQILRILLLEQVAKNLPE